MPYTNNDMPRYKTHRKTPKTRQLSLEHVFLGLILILAGGAFFLTKHLNSVLSLRRNSSYTLRKLPSPLGYEVLGLDLMQPIPESVLESLRRDIHQHGLLLFRNVSFEADKERMFKATQLFGEISGPDWDGSDTDIIFKNYNKKGQNNFAAEVTQFFHTDAYKQRQPPLFGLYHMAKVSRGASTHYVPLEKLLKCVPKERAQYWSRLSTLYDENYNNRPLVWQHPITKRPTMRIGIAKVSFYSLFLDDGLPAAKELGPSTEISSEIEERIRKDCSHLVYTHFWQENELVVTDNWGVAHAAGDDAHLPIEEVGERLMLRTLVKGDVLPRRYYIE